MRSLSRYFVIVALAASATVALSLHSVANKPLAPEEPGAPATDPQLAGIWLMESGVNQGQPIPKEQIRGSRMIVRADSISVVDKDEAELYRCTYDYNPSAKPTAITMTSTMPDREESKVLGIYKVSEKELTLCYALPGGERPTAFKSTKEGKTMLFKFKRPPEVD
ncbi:TIGR03067 domain-containing protein [Candidatus Laterigemmans baculatus]|uniref:TIGR03067 domain-containing protein n=1 Tax=Candidatus Laterigemmans baculatus TaxID=2770505 RepID=UPI0013DD15F4|nr:TIGR03067 domain-containing protein [Candidatus Laterigemmans baculatus]